jgi:hypothetical protein
MFQRVHMFRRVHMFQRVHMFRKVHMFQRVHRFRRVFMCYICMSANSVELQEARLESEGIMRQAGMKIIIIDKRYY